MAIAGWFQVERSLHPSWRRQRRVIRACEKAFEEGEYRLVRIRLRSGEPSLGDFLPGPNGGWEVPRYFTYDLEAEADPDFSGASSAERRLVRRYLRRNADHVHHYGRKPLRPRPSSPPRQTEDAKLSSPVTLKGQTLWFGKIELYENEIVISGWTWSGPVAEEIPIPSLLLFETWSERQGTNFRLEIDGAPPTRGRIESGVGLWESKMETDERVDLQRRINY